MKKIQYKGATYVEAEQPQRFYLITISGVSLLVSALSPAAAKQKAVSMLRPNPAWKASDLVPHRVLDSVVGKLMATALGTKSQDSEDSINNAA